MAENKNSFVMYTDNKELWEEVTDEQAGKLIKHIFKYVSDENPKAPDEMTKLLFIPIKYQLKRDLKKYEKRVERNRENGAKGGRPPKEEPEANTTPAGKKEPKEPTGLNGLKIKPKKADSDSVSDSDSEINSITTIYSEKEFLKDWNSLRTEHLKKPSFLNKLAKDELDLFRDVSKDYSREDFCNALTGLFKQKKLPNGNTTMQSSPRHFLNHFNPYLTAFHDKNNALYGAEKIEA